MSFNKVIIFSGITLLASQSLGIATPPSEELVLSKQNCTTDGWTQTITAIVTNTSPFFYKSAEVDIKFTRGLALNSPTVSTAVTTTKNVKPGGIWIIKYAVPASIFHNDDERGYIITRVLGIRNGNLHVSYRSSSDDVPFIFINGDVLHGSMTSLKFAIKAGADVNVQNDKGNTPLIEAVVQDEPAPVAALLAAKADPNIENYDGTTALDYALEDLPGEAKEAIVSALKKSGAIKGSGYKAIYSQGHELFAHVQKVTSQSGDLGTNINIIEGTVTNLTAHSFSSVEINANFQDGSIGNVVGTGSANVQNLGPHETWHFKITSLADNAYEYKLTKLECH